MNAPPFHLLFLLILLPGCITAPAQATCEVVTIPPIHRGDAYRFAVTGRLVTLDFETALVDYRGVDDRAPARASQYAFPPGSTLDLTIGTSPQQRLGQAGLFEEALQIAWVFTAADFPTPVHAFDEWVATSGGHLVQAHTRMMLYDGTTYEHQIRTTMDARPPMLLAPLFANQTLHRGWTLEWTIPAERALPEVETVAGHATAKVVALTGDPCVATVDVQVTWPRQGRADLNAAYGTYEIQLVFGSTHPVPLTYRTQWNGPATEAPVRLELQSGRTGPGPALPPFQNQPPAHAPHEPRPTRDGLPADVRCAYGTCLAAASSHITSNATVQRWLEAHPMARVWMISHAQAERSSRYLDGWRIVWDDDTGSLSATSYAPRDPVATNATLRIHQGEPKMASATTRPISITIDTLADLHERVFEGPPEALTCFYAAGICGVGTHAGIGEPRIDDALRPSEGRFLLGVIMGMETGLVHQVHLKGDARLGPTPERRGTGQP